MLRLINAVQHVDRQKELVSENAIATAALAKLKQDRKVVIRYIQLVPELDTTGEYISPLISVSRDRDCARVRSPRADERLGHLRPAHIRRCAQAGRA